jgi:dihydrodipicolinate synthase/N-acetylneuraminate lyase
VIATCYSEAPAAATSDRIVATPMLTGTIVPLVTPFDTAEQFDRAAFSRLVAFIRREGADALMPTALTGEGPLLTAEETIAVWEATFAEAGGVDVVPALIVTTTRSAVGLAQHAYELGASALMVAPIVPELYAARSRRDVTRFYEEVASATPLPLILFNYPSLTGVDLTPEFLAELAEIENVRYVKESTGDSRRVHAIHRRLEVICGNPTAAFESIALGCRAWITGILNVVCGPARHLMDALLRDGDMVRARRIYYERVLPLVDIMFANCNPTGTIKAALRARGVGVGFPRRPGSDVSAEDFRALQEFAGLIAAAEA